MTLPGPLNATRCKRKPCLADDVCEDDPNDGPPTTPTDCADLGTCDTCTNLRYTDTGWCYSSREQTLSRVNCVWQDAWPVARITLNCDSGTTPDKWKLYLDDDPDYCTHHKTLSTCPEGVYALSDDDCRGDCAATLTVYPV